MTSKSSKKKYALSKIAKNVQTRREDMELTRDQLSRKAKVNYNTIVKLESGANKNPTAKTLIGLSHVLNCSVEDLLT
ncbi:hypothetical protein COX00_02460 [Candidatus Uhrbacteria bacterium CG22_combo_CG10-13_8_21_14_all_47_17]|uniref:HTH cro/C1-type domain-containing protein n=1 Tax=Candidatus Uhrbacteria bacterium CG22_combo_CG10-13_8_21_14_all_47_17 TaxID=1975041 RepID=A0A2H0BUA4_9BACT|nr:MAG: hypothetical protein COX00_02460 [Candidatus Uhrbacteria bacterium CG22_combo_CG10-13_8_21_14_all_47_17]